MENLFEEAKLVLRRLGYMPDSGVTFEEQVMNIAAVLKRQPALPAGQRNTGDRANDYSEIFAATLQRLQGVETLVQLQGRLVILNVNEFKLRFHPEERQFLDLLRDFESWELRWRNRWAGTEAEIQRAADLLNQVIATAKAKYQELATTSES